MVSFETDEKYIVAIRVVLRDNNENYKLLTI